MVKLSGTTRHRRVIAAVNPDPDDVEQSGLNAKILDLAAALARLDGAELHVVHAWQFFGEGALRSSRVGLTPAQADAIIESNRAQAFERLEQLVRENRPADIVPQVHLVRGDAALSLLRAVGELRADLLVMGTVSRTGIAGLIIGNTAETVLNRVNCSVLAVKPDGFVSPVRLPAPEEHPAAATHLEGVPRISPVVPTSLGGRAAGHGLAASATEER
jgi:nucleotide-binding universal stress UspA family protein